MGRIDKRYTQRIYDVILIRMYDVYTKGNLCDPCEKS